MIPPNRRVPPGPVEVAVPAGTRLRLDRRTRVLDDGDVLLGGRAAAVAAPGPGRPGAAARRARSPVSDPTSAALARRLLDAGIAHPVEVPAAAVPARGRGDRGGAGQGPGRPGWPGCSPRCRPGWARVVVVDDDSADPGAVRAVADRGRGPGAAPPARPGPGRRAQHRAGRGRHAAGGLPRLRRGARAGLARPAAGRVRRSGGRAGRAADRGPAADHRVARAGTRRCARRWISARTRRWSCRAPGWPTCPARPWWCVAPPSAPVSTSGCRWPRTSTWCCGCTRRAGGCATFRPRGSRTTTGPGSRPGGCARPSTAPGPRRWPSGTAGRCRRWCSPRPRPGSSRCC